jgi:arginase family enzyme
MSTPRGRKEISRRPVRELSRAVGGVIAGLGSGTGVIWIDAHGDFNTPQTTTSGFLTA